MAEENQHIITATEIGSLGTLGFMLEVPAGVIPEGFLNLHFGGLEVSGFLGQVDALLAPLAVPPTRKKLALDDPPPVLVLSYISGDLTDSATTLVLKRTFTRDAGVLQVSHDYFILPEAARKQKIGRKVLAACLEQYEKMGVAKILVHVGLEDGGYVWAKAGFKAVNRPQSM